MPEAVPGVLMDNNDASSTGRSALSCSFTNVPAPPSAPGRPPSSTLGRKLFLLVAWLVFPALGLVLYGNWEQRQGEAQLVQQGAMALSQLAAADEENLVLNAHQLLATLTEFPFLVLSTNREFCENDFRNLRKLAPDYLNFGLIETDGTLFCSADLPEPVRPRATHSYFHHAVSTRRFSVGDYQVGILSKQPSLNFASPVLDTNGVARRLVFASLKLSRLSDALGHIRLSPGSRILVLDRKGNILACQPDAAKWTGRCFAHATVIRRALDRGSSVFEAPGLDGVSRLNAVTALSTPLASGLFVLVGIPLADSFAHANAMLVRNVLVLVILAALLLAVARFYASRSFLRPIGILVGAAERFAGGDLAARVGPIEGAAELHQLAAAFDHMAAKLQSRQDELESAHRQITGLNRDLERRVQERTAQLEAINKELEAFSYSVSHDLRAPLRHIEGYVGLICNSGANGLPQKSVRYLNQVVDSSKHMGRLIDDLLAFSRMGRTELKPATCDLGQLVREAIRALQPETEGRQVVWKLGDIPCATADPRLMRQVFANLLGNAVKYTRPRNPAEIEVGCQANETDQLVVFVRDNGVGFDMRYADKLFGVFQRLHLDDEFEGTGIGLANVQRIVARHGGRIWAEAKVNAGATFYFSIPNHSPPSNL